MTWLNRHEVEDTVRLAKAEGYTVAEKGARILQRLVWWTDSNSDGWSSWRKPGAAASRLQDALHARFFSAWDVRLEYDMTEAELRSALSPIKAFLTRQGVDHDPIINEPAPPPPPPFNPRLSELVEYELTTEEGVQYSPLILIERNGKGDVVRLEVGLNVTLPEIDADGNHTTHTTRLVPSTDTGEGPGTGNVFWYEDDDPLSHIAWGKGEAEDSP